MFIAVTPLFHHSFIEGDPKLRTLKILTTQPYFLFYSQAMVRRAPDEPDVQSGSLFKSSITVCEA